jgi:putative tricarboxylic transport membrane protein
MKKVVETDEWQAYLDENYLTEDVRWGEDFETFLSETQEQFETILKEQGAL